MNTGNFDTGYINSYDPFKGFGFIRRLKGKDIFFHYSDLLFDEGKALTGSSVRFQIEETPKGFRARKIEKTN